MESAPFRVRRRLFVAIGLLIIASGVWYMWIWYRTPPLAQANHSPRPFVQMSGAGQGNSDPMVQERAELFDPTPLFIPTDRNYGQGQLPSRVVRQPGQVFGNYPAKPHFAESGLASYGSAIESSPDSLPEVLSRGNEAPFAGFGQIDIPRKPLPQRVLNVEVKYITTGIIVLSQNITTLKLPKSDFAPVEFIASVGTTGLLGEPMLTAGSGSDDLDATLRDYLSKELRLGERLAPGRYLVAVGP